MKIFAVEDERLALEILSRAIAEAVPDAELKAFSRVSAVLSELEESAEKPDVVFLDIEMPGMTGLELAHLIKRAAPSANIIFVTGYSQYALEALSLRPSGYIMKPATREKVLEELENLRNPPARTEPPKRIRAQCFGDFEIFADGIPIKFLRAKSKELLAFLVDRRGAKYTAPAIASVIWDDGVYDSSRQKLLSVVRADMIKSLKSAGAESIINNDREGISVIPERFDCDYYMALAGDAVAANSFTGEYMSAFSWAEFTAAALTAKFADK